MGSGQTYAPRLRVQTDSVVKPRSYCMSQIITLGRPFWKIKRGLDAKKTFIAFPWQLLWLIRLGRLLPWRLRAIAGRDFRFYVRRG